MVVVRLFQEYFGPERKARISLDVDIEGPMLLIPKHAFSPELIVGDIGHVKVTNSTRYILYREVKVYKLWYIAPMSARVT